MTLKFTYTGSPARIVFGAGARDQLAASIDRLGCSRAFILSTPQQAAEAETLAASLGGRAAGVFARATMHTPVEVTEAAVDGGARRGRRLPRRGRRRVDHRPRQGDRLAHRPAADRDPHHLCRVGGDRHPRPDRRRREDHAPRPEGPARGRALRSGADARPAGRPQHHQRAQRDGACGRGPLRRRPQSDHYADGGRGARGAARGAARHRRRPAEHRGAKPRALRRLALRHGARHASPWRCTTSSATRSAAVSTCRTPRPTPCSCRTRSASTPWRCPTCSDRSTRIFGAPPGAALYDFAASLGAPTALRDLGLKEADLDRAAAIAVSKPYPNPRPFDAAAIRALLGAAWAGDRPET